jgi:hypothetical protein
MDNMGVGRDKAKRGYVLYFDDGVLDSSIAHVPLVYIEGMVLS